MEIGDARNVSCGLCFFTHYVRVGCDSCDHETAILSPDASPPDQGERVYAGCNLASNSFSFSLLSWFCDAATILPVFLWEILSLSLYCSSLDSAVPLLIHFFSTSSRFASPALSLAPIHTDCMPRFPVQTIASAGKTKPLVQLKHVQATQSWCSPGLGAGTIDCAPIIRVP